MRPDLFFYSEIPLDLYPKSFIHTLIFNLLSRDHQHDLETCLFRVVLQKYFCLYVIPDRSFRWNLNCFLWVSWSPYFLSIQEQYYADLVLYMFHFFLLLLYISHVLFYEWRLCSFSTFAYRFRDEKMSKPISFCLSYIVMIVSRIIAGYDERIRK